MDLSHLTSQATPPNQGPDMVGDRARGAEEAPLNVVDVSKILQVKPPRDKRFVSLHTISNSYSYKIMSNRIMYILYVLVITYLRGMLLVYGHDTRG